jgi:siderophore synthetase component
MNKFDLSESELIIITYNINLDSVHNVFLISSPLSLTKSEWKNIKKVVAGRLVNAYSKEDWVSKRIQTNRIHHHETTFIFLFSLTGLSYHCETSFRLVDKTILQDFWSTAS